MKSSDLLIRKLKEFEGCRLKAYKCPAGIWTIGVGHTKGVTAGMEITQERADELLREDLKVYEDFLNGLKICKRQWQFDALVSMTFNIGIAAFKRSTLLKNIQQGKSEQYIRIQFARWNKANGKVLPGLVKRRAWEADRYFGKEG